MKLYALFYHDLLKNKISMVKGDTDLENLQEFMNEYTEKWAIDRMGKLNYSNTFKDVCNIEDYDLGGKEERYILRYPATEVVESEETAEDSKDNSEEKSENSTEDSTEEVTGPKYIYDLNHVVGYVYQKKYPTVDHVGYYEIQAIDEFQLSFTLSDEVEECSDDSSYTFDSNDPAYSEAIKKIKSILEN